MVFLGRTREPGKPMRRNLWKFVLGLGLLGCGGQPNALPVGFVKPDPTFGRGPVGGLESGPRKSRPGSGPESSTEVISGAPADIRPGDPRALEILPHQLKVSAEPDVTAGVLLAATGLERSDPTGMIACPEPYNVRLPPRIPSTAGTLPDMPLGGRTRATAFPLCWSMSLRTRFWLRWVTT
jgi:hypothetical protein